MPPVCTGDPATCTIPNCACKQPKDPVCTGDPATCTIDNCACKQPKEEAPLCEQCEAALAEDGETVVHAEGCPTQCNCTPVEDRHQPYCNLYEEPEKTLTQKLMEIGNLSDLLIALLADENLAEVMALTAEEIAALGDRGEALYAKIENPTEWDERDLNDLLDTLKMLPAYRAENACPDCGMIGEHAEDCPWAVGDVLLPNGYQDLNAYFKNGGKNLSGGSYQLTADLTVGQNIRVDGNVVIDLNGYVFQFTHDNHRGIDNYGTLTIEDSRPDTSHYGTLIEYGVSGYGALWEYKPNATSGVEIKGGIITGGDGPWHGGTIYSPGKVIMNGGTIAGGRARFNNNTAENTNGSYYEHDIKGGGGAIFLVGENASLTMNNSSRIAYCVSDVWGNAGGGAVVAWGGASITMNDDSKIDHSFCPIGGGVFVDGFEHTANSRNTNVIANNGAGGTFYFNSGTIEYCEGSRGGGGGYMWYHAHAIIESDATIQNCYSSASGGGIALSISTTTLDLKGGSIINNKAGGSGGGIITIGGTINIISGLISGNQATGDGGAISVSEWIQHYIDSGYKNTDNLVCGHLNITGGTIENNTAGGNGGAIWIEGDATMSGGTIRNCSAKNGGLIYIESPTYPGIGYQTYPFFNMSGGTITGCSASEDGGAVYITSGNVNISGGEISGGKARNGGFAYVQNGDVIVSDGKITGNEASANGGAVYVTGGNFTMSGGTIGGEGTGEANTAIDGAGVYVNISNDNDKVELTGGSITANVATNNGGAAYVSGGTITMTGGTIDKNTAQNGGGVYIVGGDFVMKSGIMTGNEANGSTGAGGGAYINGGHVVIGVSGCTGSICSDDTCTEEHPNHSVDPTDKPHPIISNNKAKDSGGGLAVIVDGGVGDITMFCGDIVDNDATNRGRGWNVYMEGGLFDYYNGDVGALEKPELVIVGGTLRNNKLIGTVTLVYHHCNDKNHCNDETVNAKEATASNGAWFNLPDGEKYWDAPEGYRFFGWTFNGPDSDAANQEVHDKTQYQPLGTPIQAQDTHDDDADSVIHMYALWAPEESSITYEGIVIDDIYGEEELSETGNPGTYDFSSGDYTLELNAPEKPGYTFIGWYYYQNPGKNANWGLYPDYVDNTAEENKNLATLDYSTESQMAFLTVDSDGKCRLLVEATNFGDITLIAKFEPAYTSLRITNDGWEAIDELQSFLFRISGQPNNNRLPAVDLTVVIQGNGSVQIEELPVGTYTVQELSGWSWRYEVEEDSNSGPDPSVKTVEAEDPQMAYSVPFMNDRTENLWLDGEDSERNEFKVLHSSSN